MRPSSPYEIGESCQPPPPPGPPGPPPPRPSHRLRPNPLYSHAAEAGDSPFQPQTCSFPDRQVPWATKGARSRDIAPTVPRGCHGGVPTPPSDERVGDLHHGRNCRSTSSTPRPGGIRRPGRSARRMPVSWRNSAGSSGWRTSTRRARRARPTSGSVVKPVRGSSAATNRSISSRASCSNTGTSAGSSSASRSSSTRTRGVARSDVSPASIEPTPRPNAARTPGSSAR
jgi:hypothetical protein